MVETSLFQGQKVAVKRLAQHLAGATDLLLHLLGWNSVWSRDTDQSKTVEGHFPKNYVCVLK